MLTEKENEEMREYFGRWYKNPYNSETRIGFQAAYTLLLPKLRQAEERVKVLEDALGRIEAGCSFPDNEVEKAIVKVARAALSTEPKGE